MGQKIHGAAKWIADTPFGRLCSKLAPIANLICPFLGGAAYLIGKGVGKVMNIASSICDFARNPSGFLSNSPIWQNYLRAPL